MIILLYMDLGLEVTLKNISQSHPMAIFNNGVSNITYTGDSNKNSRRL